ncbi:hypothetical protein BJ508DRAFT_377391 [Ascobolus immersus RN42]|uniref:Uncharacterized protein n=1 Tax=Ascobolus immersus RN42 TaxID=1160509 RepID=A0A3N4I149_ASCIM|nr:hypothetical protein BJ508DRAFT_377391 [Ascobolus immersus RN42]
MISKAFAPNFLFPFLLSLACITSIPTVTASPVSASLPAISNIFNESHNANPEIQLQSRQQWGHGDARYKVHCVETTYRHDIEPHGSGITIQGYEQGWLQDHPEPSLVKKRWASKVSPLVQPGGNDYILLVSWDVFLFCNAKEKDGGQPRRPSIEAYAEANRRIDNDCWSHNAGMVFDKVEKVAYGRLNIYGAGMKGQHPPWHYKCGSFLKTGIYKSEWPGKDAGPWP